MKKLVAVILVAFAVTLAVVVGNRMSTDAMAVVIGIVCGVGASIPTSLLIMAVTSRRETREERGQASFPPVVIAVQAVQVYSSDHWPSMTASSCPMTLNWRGPPWINAGGRVGGW